MTFRMYPVTTVVPGDVVQFPGSFAHEDLAGLVIEERVEAVELSDDGRTFLYWPNGQRTWWSNLEMVAVQR